MYFSFGFSSAILVVISVEKFLALYFPFKTKAICTVRMARRISLVTAVVYLAFHSQMFVLSQMYYSDDGEYCSYGNVPAAYIKIFFAVFVSTLYSYGPFAIMILANMGIIYKFMRAKYKNTDLNTESTNQALSKSATRGTAMLSTISFTFIVLTGPIVLINAIWPDGDYSRLIFKIAITLQYTNHGINGILYCTSGSRFRIELKRLLRCDTSSSARFPTSAATVTTSVPEGRAAASGV